MDEITRQNAKAYTDAIIRKLKKSDQFLPDMEMIDFDKFDVEIEKGEKYPYVKFLLKFGEDNSKCISVSKRGLYKLLQYSQTL